MLACHMRRPPREYRAITHLLMARMEMPLVSNRHATSAIRARMFLRSPMRVPLSAYFMLVLSSAGRGRTWAIKGWDQ